MRGNAWVNWRWVLLIEEYGGKCNACGDTDELEFAHIRPTGLNGCGRGKSRRLRDVLAHPDAYLLLCVECHEALDGETYRNNRGKRIVKVKA